MVCDPKSKPRRLFTPTVPINMVVHENNYPKSPPPAISDSMKAYITVTSDSTEDQVLERFRIIKSDFEARKRQQFLERATHYVSTYTMLYGICHWSTEPTNKELSDRLESLPPRFVKKQLEDLHRKIKRYEAFPEMYRQKIRTSLPVNWRDEYATVDDAVEGRMDSYKLETVAKAVGYYREMADIAQGVLNAKLAFVEQHKKYVPQLISECKQLGRKAARLQSQIIELLRKAPRGLKENEKQKLVTLILKHKKLEREHNAASAKLAAYSPDNPTVGLPAFPSTNYTLPSWIEIKVRNAERGER